MIRRDVVVVGAGPAGSLSAREIARRGASVLLVDRSDFPRRKVCGACLGTGALEVLDAVGLGALPSRLGAEPLRTLVLRAGRHRARLRLPGGCAVSRSALDDALVRAACDEGVDFQGGVRAALGPAEAHGRVVRVGHGRDASDVHAGIVIDATGLGGGLSATPDGPSSGAAPDARVGLGASFRDPAYPLALGEVCMALGRTGYVGLVRVESGVLNVAAAIDPLALQGAGASPASVVADILSGTGLPTLAGAPVDGWRGTRMLTWSPEDVGAERVLRVGDAAGYVEPFTGEGMGWAMSAAVTVAPLAVEGVGVWRADLLEEWREYHRTVLGRSQRLCRLLAAGLRRPALVEGALAGLAVLPALARPLVRRAGRMPPLSPAHSA